MKLTKERYIKLRLAEEKLNALEMGGVDNWEWYGDSLLDNHYDEDILIREIGKEYNNLI